MSSKNKPNRPTVPHLCQRWPTFKLGYLGHIYYFTLFIIHVGHFRITSTLSGKEEGQQRCIIALKWPRSENHLRKHTHLLIYNMSLEYKLVVIGHLLKKLMLYHIIAGCSLTIKHNYGTQEAACTKNLLSLFLWEDRDTLNESCMKFCKCSSQMSKINIKL